VIRVDRRISIACSYYDSRYCLALASSTLRCKILAETCGTSEWLTDEIVSAYITDVLLCALDPELGCLFVECQSRIKVPGLQSRCQFIGFKKGNSLDSRTAARLKAI
jgi:hypothetical protein